jgi:hypothetical protein
VVIAAEEEHEASPGHRGVRVVTKSGVAHLVVEERSKAAELDPTYGVDHVMIEGPWATFLTPLRGCAPPTPTSYPDDDRRRQRMEPGPRRRRARDDDARRASHRLILHGRYVCTARSPDCGACVVADLCPSRAE